MPFILGLVAVAGIAYLWFWRARNAAQAASELMDAANDVRLAARRFGFRRKRDTHPVDGIDDARVAGAGLVMALLMEGGVIRDDRRRAALAQMLSVFDTDHPEAEELATLGQWLVGQCASAPAAFTRLAKKLDQLAGAEVFPDLQRMITAVFIQDGGLDPVAEDALTELRQRFRIH
jgi:hypothetical protein